MSYIICMISIVAQEPISTVFHCIFQIMALNTNLYEKFFLKKSTRRNPIIQIVIRSALSWVNSELISKSPMRRNSFNLNFSLKRWAPNMIYFQAIFRLEICKINFFLSYLVKTASYHIPLDREFSKDSKYTLIAVLLQVQTKL